MHTHFWIPSEHESYDVCLECNSLHNRIPFPKENYLDEYWSEKRGHSTLQDQRFNLESFVNEKGESKVQVVLKHCVGETILEVACAPGSFLKTAIESGFGCHGIEPDPEYAKLIHEYIEPLKSGCWISTGFFEDQVFAGDKYSNIVAMDLMEHLEFPEQFIERAMGLLEDGGRLILMLPLADTCRDIDFHPEHINLFSRKFIEEWLTPIIIEDWYPGHTIVVVEKPKIKYAIIPDEDGRLMVEI